jgi:hypothetical protein
VPGLVATWIVRVLIVAACVLVGSTLTEHGAFGGVVGGLMGLAGGLVAVGMGDRLTDVLFPPGDGPADDEGKT